MTTSQGVSRLMSRLAERAKPPRSWWFPSRDDPALQELAPDRVQQDFLEISSNIAKTVVTMLAFSFFCVFTLLGAPDRELIAAGSEITIPVAKVGVSFTGFLVLGPLLLVAFFLHLHIFVAYWLALGKVADKARRGAHVFNLPFPSTRLLSALLFYWLVPAVIGVFAWKAAPQPAAGRLLFLTFLATILWSLLTQIRRCPESRRRWNAPRWAVFAVAVFALVSSSGGLRQLDLYASIRSWRGGLKLQEAELAGHDLRGRFLENADLTGAVLTETDLRDASLADATLARANLSGADLSLSDLRRADLTDAILTPASAVAGSPHDKETEPSAAPGKPTRLVGTVLIEARLAGADLAGADLADADLTAARTLSGRSASMSRANLSRARLESAHLPHVDLRGANLVQAKMRGAELPGAQLNPAEDGTATDLTEAALMETDLSGADLRGVILRGANLKGADLSKADLRASSRLVRDQLASACIQPGQPALLPEEFLEQPPPCRSGAGSR